MIALLFAMMVSAPLLKEQMYPINVISCDGEAMVVETKGSTFNVSLFNVEIKTEEGRQYSCQRVAEASRVEMKIDRYATAIDHITVWVYVDDDILQKELVELGYASMIIRNPEYSHYQQMIEASVQANAEFNEILDQSREFDRQRANRFLFINMIGISVSSIIFALYLFWQIKKEKSKI